MGQYPNAEDMAATREGKSGAQIGVPLFAANVPLAGATSLSDNLGPAPVRAPAASAAPVVSAASAPVAAAASMPRRRLASAKR